MCEDGTLFEYFEPLTSGGEVRPKEAFLHVHELSDPDVLEFVANNSFAGAPGAMDIPREYVRLLRDALTKWLGERVVEFETRDESGCITRTRTETRIFHAENDAETDEELRTHAAEKVR